MLGLGVLFLSIYTTGSSGTNGTAGVSVLFGSILGLSPGAARAAALIGLLVCSGVIAMARPLLFASIDETVAEAAGVPVRFLGVMFLGIVGITAAETTQAVGALLLLGLLTAPAAAAHLLTKRPGAGLALSVVLAVGSAWVGLSLAYVVPSMPPSFGIVAVATLTYATATVFRRSRRSDPSARREPSAVELATESRDA
jgi:zinc/manganese transport system permease protein